MNAVYESYTNKIMYTIITWGRGHGLHLLSPSLPPSFTLDHLTPHPVSANASPMRTFFFLSCNRSLVTMQLSTDRLISLVHPKFWNSQYIFHYFLRPKCKFSSCQFGFLSCLLILLGFLYALCAPQLSA